VRKPDYVHRVPTEKEIGEEGKQLISSYKWSEAAQMVIEHTCNIGRRGTNSYRKKKWKEITVGDVVKRFVRMKRDGKPYFWTTGHYGSVWYHWERLIDALHECTPEIERFLFDHNFLETIREPEKEEL
jgi:hypothetical protein